MADLALELLRHGYRALPRLWMSQPDDDDYAKTRLLGGDAHVMRGEEAARLFYDETVVDRRGPVPAPMSHVLFGKGAVHGLDGVRHRVRKDIFLDVLTPERVEVLGADVDRELFESLLSWPARTPFGLFDELVRIYGTCALSWAGVQLEPHEAATVATRLASIVDGFGIAPNAYPRARWARWWANRWPRGVVQQARDGDGPARSGTCSTRWSQAPVAGFPAKLPPWSC